MSSSRIILIILTLFIVLGTAGLLWQRQILDASQPKKQRLTIVTTLFPLYDMVRALGGDAVIVTLLLPPGTEAHAFEPTPRDIITINTADIFIYTGPVMEPWVDDILGSLHNPDMVIVNASEHITPITDADTHGTTSPTSDADEPTNTDAYTGVDPHVWLNPANASVMVNDIASAIIEARPDLSQTIASQLVIYTDTLSRIDTAYSDTFATCNQKTIVYGGHYAFGYMANRYGLTYASAQGFSPDTEPTASDLAELANRLKTLETRTVFYDPIENKKIAETIARETGATLAALSPGHTVSKQEFDAGITFFDILTHNLSALRSGLSCQ